MSLRRAAVVGTTAALALAFATPAHAQSGPASVQSDSASVQSAAIQYKLDRLANAPQPVLSAADAALLATKERAALANRAGQADRTSNALATTTGALWINRQQQQTGYWCGPAATSMALQSLGIWLSQTDAAWGLRTTTDGTAWYGVNAQVAAPTGYPIRDVLNYKLGRNFYVPISLPGNPTAANKSAYQIFLQNDINAGYPIVANAWEAPGGPHLFGHPNQEIFHWYTIYGYYSSGAGTYYADSASFAANGGLNAMASDTITVINGGRGYIW